ncbi:hypothetical protein A9Q02_14805 [Candidatus Chloroploca asiatica]|uniref:Uncharacterized protein n=1 Tax=Candidatus Chloroploca asiatica TaxID=1506545 RepID=A0A2H3KKU7_9CHLR|nr:hypothetical protein A9Q02_14805 [Candidatus Chloroploca asiatica]
MALRFGRSVVDWRRKHESEQSHSNDVAPKYAVVFPNDAVSTLRNIIAPDYRLEHFAECAVSG